MTPFLQQVAKHYYRTGEVWGACLVFPNRRSLAFFRKYLSDEMAADPSSQAHFAPETVTINDFFYRSGGFAETDKVTLLLALYEVYKDLSPLKEPLDEFIFWGDVLLSDFDDIDKYLVDARGLFTNVSEFKAIQNSFEYLSEGQRKAIERFSSHFRDRSFKEGDVKGRFLQIWNILGPLYERFRASLKERGLSYEGMVYRDLAERIRTEAATDIVRKAFPRSGRFIFVGLNALNECEKKVLAKLRDAGVARFVWDYRSSMIRDRRNKSSLFLGEFTQAFPSDFETDPEGLPDPEIEVVSVPSGVGQAKLLPELLKGLGDNWIRTAVVLPDESLLTPVLSSIPPEVADINVTMGYPMKGSALYSLMGQVATMQMHLRKLPEGWYFYHKQVRSIFSESLFRSLLTEDEAAVADKVVSEAKYYIPASDFPQDGLLAEVFRPVVLQPSQGDAAQNEALLDYLLGVVRSLAARLSASGGNMLELDFSKRYHTAVSQLAGIRLEVLPVTFIRLVDQLLATLTVPFSGEPLKGLQVMGPLETRALDFDNVIILSSGEGVFPRRSVSSSFIPPELRRGFGLPTYEYQDAVWAYYFYRLIQRSSRVFLVYDSRTEGVKSGEESRYIKQLQYYFKKKLTHRTAVATVRPVSVEPDIVKTPEDVEIIRQSTLSASSLQNYLKCNAMFYYQVVKGLRETEDVAENMDGGMVGRVFHKIMQDLYTTPDNKVSVTYLKKILADEGRIRGMIDKGICEELRTLEVTGRDLVTADILLQYVRKTISRDIAYLQEHGAPYFEILGLEKKIYHEIDGFAFKGVIDRLDRIPGGKVRIVDYKTGYVSDDDIDIRDDNAEGILEKLFGEENAARPKIALQLYLYDVLAGVFRKEEPDALLNAIYATSRLMKDPVADYDTSPVFLDLMAGRLKDLLQELVDPDVPMRRKKDPDTCKYCGFKTLCGV